MMRFLPLSFLICFCFSLPFSSAAEDNTLRPGMRVAFLTAEATLEEMGEHSLAAWQFLAEQPDTEILFNRDNAGFIDRSGTARELSEFDVVWYHQGDDVRDTALYRGAQRTEILEFMQSGKGVLLSGGALEMVIYFGLEKLIRPQRHYQENWRDPAPLVFVEKTHPVFHGLYTGEEEIPLSRGGCRAVADFYWGGPGEGMVLANSPAGVHRPLVEYASGKGRLLTFGWRWPDYADLDNPDRDALLRLTCNMLNYLGTPEQWQPFRIRSEFPYTRLAGTGMIDPLRFEPLRRSISHLIDEYGSHYPQGEEYLTRLDELVRIYEEAQRAGDRATLEMVADRFEALQREAMLANPLLDFEKILFIKRNAEQLGLPDNSYGNEYLAPTGYNNSLQALSYKTNEAPYTVFTPENDVFIGDLDLHYDGAKMLLSVPDLSGKWGVGELDLESGTLRMLPLIPDEDVHNFDACYLPDERIVFTSTAPYIGVPCVGGRSKVTNLYLLEKNGAIRRLTNDQDHNWCPAVLNDGRLLYLRWEYADIAHAFMRILFSANPDGCRQMEYYGSNSFWPTAMFFARAVPDHPSRFVAIVGGHHDAHRQGELILFDTSLGRHEADGVVQRIPGYGKKVEPVILDGLISASWPRFLHPYPLSDSYYITACQPDKNALWGIYLVDRFDNFTLLHEEESFAMLEPTAWRKTKRPPVIPDCSVPGAEESVIQLADVYHGPGTAGIPRGTIKKLRIIGYEYTFHNFGCEPDRVGMDGPWDVRRILGTVPVEEDGSAHFTVPAMTPVAVQPLDEDGKAVALMRSWFTAAPGEALSCVGCHEPQNSAAPPQYTPQAFKRPPDNIAPWYGPARGFSFQREIQPVLDAHCVTCHDGAKHENIPDFTDKPVQKYNSAFQLHFSPSYMALRSWVHTPTLESDAHMLPAKAFHADTSMLIQILRDGHYSVQLDEECMDRLITWIDLNAPFHGSWQECVAYSPEKSAAALKGAEQRRELHKRYTGIDEAFDALSEKAVITHSTASDPSDCLPREYDGTVQETAGILTHNANSTTRTIAITPELSLDFVLIPPGEFIFGSDSGYPNEAPARKVTIEKAFYMGKFEISNAQYAVFDPDHDSGLETGEGYQFGDDERGFPLNRPEQPVVRISWNQAVAFCEWLSARTGLRFSLPTEEQWEYACRAGTNTAFWYGSLDTDFAATANLSDATHYEVYYPHVPSIHPPWRPADTCFNDTWRVSAPVDAFQANPWGVHNMHGNAAEWTISTYHSDSNGTEERKVVRGGSWMDIPKRARSAFRLHYNASQGVHDVGFRVVCSTLP